METRGTTRPAKPSERTNGTGMMSSNESPMATAIPESSTVRPGRRHRAARPHRRRRSQSVGQLLAEAMDDEEGVVDWQARGR